MTVVTFTDAMKIALQHHGAGRLAEAEAVCRKILTAEPEYPDALHLMAIIAGQAGNDTAALDYYARAAARDPENGILFVRYARALRASGRIKEAADALARGAKLRPKDADTWFNLGEMRRGLGQWDAALAAYEHTRTLIPKHPEVWGALARAHIALGHTENGIVAARQALTLKPGTVSAQVALASGLLALGRTAEAEAAAREALRLAPDNPEARSLLDQMAPASPTPVSPTPASTTPASATPASATPASATPASATVASPGGEPALPPDAVEPVRELVPVEPPPSTPEQRLVAARHLVSRNPDDVDAHRALGLLLVEMGLLSEAVALLRRVLDLQPRDAEVLRHLGQVLKELRRLDEAAVAWREAIALMPGDTGLRAGYGRLLLDLGRAEEAVEVFRAVEAAQPNEARAALNLGGGLLALGRLEEAEACYRQALSRDAQLVEAHTNLGMVLHAQGRLDEAIASLERAVELKADDPAACSALLFCLNRQPGRSGLELARDHRRFEAAIGRPAVPAHANAPDPDRPLRVGYVSPDFRQHPVMAFFEPVLASHNRGQVRATLYSNVTRPDAVTARLRGRADGWRDVTGLGDAELAEMIRADGIDILVDLAGHTAGNRLSVFAAKPAPVQLTWLGYANTTGLSAIDGRLTDAVADPADADDSLFAEAPIRLTPGFHCYLPPAEAPEVAPPPAETAGVVTFGAFAQLPKLTAEQLKVWGRILDRVPGSRLALKSRPLADAGAQRRLLDLAAGQGIDTGRIRILDWAATTAEHLAQYGQIDIALDPFPCNAAATLCEALWMGVPVVALNGDRHAARIGASLLVQAGLPDLITADVDHYIETAAALAADAERRAWLRTKLRTRLRLSSLCDAKAFTRSLEEAYRGLWRDWCAKATPDDGRRSPLSLKDRAAPALTPLVPGRGRSGGFFR